MSVNHPNSKVVFLRRAPMSIPEASNSNDAEVKAYFDNAFRALGSYWTKGSMRVGTGLNIQEENILMPYLLNIPAQDRDFREKATQFFHDISTKVDPVNSDGKGGTRLEVGLFTDNDEPISEKNLPLNVSDYIRWRHALTHPEVAMSEEESRSSSLKHYYIFDPVTVRNTSVSDADFKDESFAGYLEVKKNPDVINQYLTLLNIDPAKHRGAESVKLREVAEKQPKEFLKVHLDKDKNGKFLIKSLVNAGVLEELGTRLLIKENGFQIGGTLQEAIAYLKDKENTQQLAIFKALVQDYRKKKFPELTDKTAEGSPAEPQTTA